MIHFMMVMVLALGWSVEGTLEDYLRHEYPWQEVTVTEVVPDSPLPAAPPREIRTLRRSAGRMTFLLLFDDGKSSVVTARVRAYDWVIRTRVPVAKGTVLDETTVYRELSDVRRIPAGALRSLADVKGRVAARSMVADRVIRERDVRASAAVRRGEEISIVYETGGLRITMPGIARENGAIGDRIRIENTTSGKILTGRLVDRETARVGW